MKSLQNLQKNRSDLIAYRLMGKEVGLKSILKNEPTFFLGKSIT